MTSFLEDGDIVCVFYLFVMVVGYWEFWAGDFQVLVSKLTSRYTEDDKQLL